MTWLFVKLIFNRLYSNRFVISFVFHKPIYGKTSVDNCSKAKNVSFHNIFRPNFERISNTLSTHIRL